MNRATRMDRFVLLGGLLLVFGASLCAGPMLKARSFPQSASDNSKNNQGDADKSALTADQQKTNPADQELTRKIRAAVMDDKSLSTYAHNIKIITQDGKVTLKGPVRSGKEKKIVESKAFAVAGAPNVSSEITVAPSPKS